MPSDAYREARAAAKQARASAKEARRRWLRLRPWYFKKRYILGVPILVALGAAVAFIAISLEYGDADSDTTTGQPSEAAATPDATAAGAARVGSTLRVGSIDLTILAFEPVDGRTFSAANDANYRLRFRATNARGPSSESYRLVNDAFHLVDASGATKDDWHGLCQNCPDALGTGVSLALNASIEGAVYFHIPAGQSPAELHYRAPGSTNTGRVALR